MKIAEKLEIENLVKASFQENIKACDCKNGLLMNGL